MNINKKHLFIVLAGTAAVIAAGFGALAVYGNVQSGKIPEMTFRDCLDYTLSGEKNAVITVGTITDGVPSYTVYGENSEILPKEAHDYEIGSLTKTLTAALANKAADESLISLDSPIDAYLDLPEKEHYPTVKELVTHTSGYKPYYFESPMTGNFLNGRNDFCGIGDSTVKNRLAKVDIADGEYPFNYSNFGYASLGLILENVYSTEFTTLMNSYLHDDLGLENTHISECSGDLDNYWEWTAGDTYLSAGGVISNIEDMLSYAQMQLDGSHGFDRCHDLICDINASSESYKKMGINMDGIAMAWIIDSENGFIWHNGGTGNYNAYLGVCPEKGTAVVVLSNLPPNTKIPSTVLGAKLLNEIS